MLNPMFKILMSHKSIIGQWTFKRLSKNRRVFFWDPIRIDPALSVNQLERTIKSITARVFFQKRPEVKRYLWGGSFWTSGYLCEYSWSLWQCRSDKKVCWKSGQAIQSVVYSATQILVVFFKIEQDWTVFEAIQQTVDDTDVTLEKNKLLADAVAKDLYE